MIAEDIIQGVCGHFHISEYKLKSSDKRPAVARPRMLAMYLLRNELGYSYPSTAELLKRLAHQSAMHACRDVSAALESGDEQWRRDRDEVLRRAREFADVRERGLLPLPVKGKRVQFVTYLEPWQVAGLRALSEATKVPAAELVRQGVTGILEKRAGELRKTG